MNVPRETIYEALFQKLATLSAGGTPLFKSTSRRLKHWNDVAPELQPSLYVIQLRETAVQVRGMPNKWRCSVDAYIYVHTGAQQDPNVIPSQLLNPLLDAVEAALAPEAGPENVQTLGGLVSHCWIEGDIETSEGLLGDQEVAIVPINFLTTS